MTPIRDNNHLPFRIPRMMAKVPAASQITAKASATIRLSLLNFKRWIYADNHG